MAKRLQKDDKESSEQEDGNSVHTEGNDTVSFDGSFCFDFGSAVLVQDDEREMFPDGPRRSVSEGEMPLDAPRRFLGRVHGSLRSAWRTIRRNSSRVAPRQSRDEHDADNIENRSGRSQKGTDLEKQEPSSIGDTRTNEFQNPLAASLDRLHEDIRAPETTMIPTGTATNDRSAPVHRPSLPGAFRIRPGGVPQSASDYLSRHSETMTFDSGANSNPTFLVSRASVIGDGGNSRLQELSVYNAAPIQRNGSTEDALVLNRCTVRWFILGAICVLVGLTAALYFAVESSLKSDSTDPWSSQLVTIAPSLDVDLIESGSNLDLIGDFETSAPDEAGSHELPPAPVIPGREFPAFSPIDADPPGASITPESLTPVTSPTGATDQETASPTSGYTQMTPSPSQGPSSSSQPWGMVSASEELTFSPTEPLQTLLVRPTLHPSTEGTILRQTDAPTGEGKAPATSQPSLSAPEEPSAAPTSRAPTSTAPTTRPPPLPTTATPTYQPSPNPTTIRPTMRPTWQPTLPPTQRSTPAPVSTVSVSILLTQPPTSVSTSTVFSNEAAALVESNGDQQQTTSELGLAAASAPSNGNNDNNSGPSSNNNGSNGNNGGGGSNGGGKGDGGRGNDNDSGGDGGSGGNGGRDGISGSGSGGDGRENNGNGDRGHNDGRGGRDNGAGGSGGGGRGDSNGGGGNRGNDSNGGGGSSGDGGGGGGGGRGKGGGRSD